jgi:hypothetical protein
MFLFTVFRERVFDTSEELQEARSVSLTGRSIGFVPDLIQLAILILQTMQGINYDQLFSFKFRHLLTSGC